MGPLSFAAGAGGNGANLSTATGASKTARPFARGTGSGRRAFIRVGANGSRTSIARSAHQMTCRVAALTRVTRAAPKP